MEDGKELSLEQIWTFVKGNEGISFSGEDRGEMYAWMEGLLRRHEYWKRPREGKGLLRSYAEKTTGLSRAQTTRLIARYLKDGNVAGRPYRRHRFGTRYTRDDVELLAAVILSKDRSVNKVVAKEPHALQSQNARSPWEASTPDEAE